MEDQESTIFPVRTVYAGFGQRLLAFIIDGIILAIPGQVITKVFGSGFMWDFRTRHWNITAAVIFAQLLITAINWLYFALMESGSSQGTVGKQALSIKVTDLSGNRISFSRATGRYFAKTISIIILLFGYLMVLWDDQNQALHDKLAKTLVVKKLPPM